MKLNPAARDLLSQIAQGEIGPALAGRARKLLDEERESKERDETRKATARKRRLAKSLPRRKEEAAEARKATAMRAEIRRLAMEREGGRCAICPRHSRLHMHHVIGRHDERLLTVAMLCWAHHDRRSAASVHAGNAPALRALAAWCVEHGYADAARAVARKLSKIEEAQQSTPTAGRRNA